MPRAKEGLQLPVSYSATQLKSFFACRLQYYLYYLIHLHQKMDIPRKSGYLMGSALHYVFKQFFTLKNGYQSVESMYNSFAHRMRGEIEGKYGRDKRPCLLKPDSEEFWKLAGRGKKLIAAFYAYNQSYRNGTFPKPEVERNFQIKFQGFNLRGSIDRIQPIGDGQVEIQDYKTGSYWATSANLFWDMQWVIYELAYFKLTGNHPGIKVVIFKDDPKAETKLSSIKIEFIEVPEITLDQYQWLAAFLTELITYSLIMIRKWSPKTCIFAKSNQLYFCREDIERGIPTPNPGRQCYWCDFEQVCMNYNPEEMAKFIQRDYVEREINRIPLEQPFFVQGKLDFGQKLIRKHQHNLFGELIKK